LQCCKSSAPEVGANIRNGNGNNTINQEQLQQSAVFVVSSSIYHEKQQQQTGRWACSSIRPRLQQSAFVGKQRQEVE
jgi:hypothetical protein